MTDLLQNIDKLHTTVMGEQRIKRNLDLNTNDIVTWCKAVIINSSEIIRRGKNWYVYMDNAVITINSHSYTIITAHRVKIKKMSELTVKDRARLYPILLTEYNPEWTEWFMGEKELIEKVVGLENIISIRHIGSTAVKGLTAKPTVDILLEITPQADLAKLKLSFPYPEYICQDRQTIPTNDILLFLKGYTPTGFADKVFHIHVRYKGDWDEIYFRDFLIAHSETAKQYAELKINLKDKFEYDRDGYTNAKGKFIAGITAKARGIKHET